MYIKKFGQRFVFFLLKEIIILFSKDTINESKVTVKKIFSNKCSFFLISLSGFPQKY